MQLLQQRNRLSTEIGRTKRRHGAEIYVPDRERELLSRVAQMADGKLPPLAAHAIFREILSSSRAAQGQPPIGLLASSAEKVVPAARCHFGSCDQFVQTRDWPDLSRRLAKGQLAIGLGTFTDLAAALQKRWQSRLQVVGEIASNAGSSSLRDTIFILKPGEAASQGNRALILIECKPTADAVKSMVSAMPQAPNLVRLAPLAGRGKRCLATLSYDQPIERSVLSKTGVLLGLYFAIESYGE